jgi:hypothetical protein
MFSQLTSRYAVLSFLSKLELLAIVSAFEVHSVYCDMTGAYSNDDLDKYRVKNGKIRI